MAIQEAVEDWFRADCGEETGRWLPLVRRKAFSESKKLLSGANYRHLSHTVFKVVFIFIHHIKTTYLSFFIYAVVLYFHTINVDFDSIKFSRTLTYEVLKWKVFYS